jgi:hypothetical protein
MIKKIFIGLAVLVALLAVAVGVVCAMATTKPDELKVTRSTSISAPPEAVFKVVNNLRRWDEWSPWSRLDPNMNKNFEGPSEGVGAIYRWNGNNEVGEGVMTVTDSKPSEKVAIKLEFKKPMEGTNDVLFSLAPEGSGTKVTWDMQGKTPFIGKVMSVFMDFEKMCGDQFNEGLANLKTVVEAEAKAPATPPTPAPAPTPAAP